MSEKVKLTREQAEAIDKIIEFADGDKEAIINGHKRDWAQDKFKPLNQMTVAKIAKSLYIGYEVEETFKVGDCVVLDDGQIVEIIEDGSFTVVVAWIINRSMYRDQINKSLIKRHATKQERWWAKHGRKPFELEINDVLLRNDGACVSVFHVDKSQERYELVARGAYQNCYEVNKEIIKTFYKVICFAEDRKDVDHA